MSAINIKEVNENCMHFTFTNGSLDVVIRLGDLSQESCDAIVNSTNSSLVPDGGLDAIIHEKMGQFFTDQVVAVHKDMQVNSCPIGQSRIFIGKFNREPNDPRFVISTAGPIYTEPEKERAGFLLQSCYYTSLALANIYQLTSIAYPAISCGANHFPPDEAARVAIDSIRRFSYNIKDVRFVLWDRATYDVFVQEWTDYAQQVNKDANKTDQMNDDTSEQLKKPKIPPPVPPKPSARYCVLCKQQKIPADRETLCLDCSQLIRSELFRKFLSNLRIASEKSYDELVHECQLLQPILKLYSLIYTPAKVFDPSIHMRDPISEHYVQQYCDKHFRNSIPLSIAGDGNCFYNTFVKLAGNASTTDGSTLTPIELRARNVVELVLNTDVYRSQYDRLSPILDKFEDYVRREMVRDTNYAAVWDLLSIPTILNIHLTCAYPKVNGPDDLNCQYLNNAQFIPLVEHHAANNQEKKSETSSIVQNVRLLFSNCHRLNNGLSKEKREWVPNHFVPLLNMS
ncbi:unnamed protein product [Rotaria sordida]|uniref:Macro domain-containing protein n=1 Tax=Rotaria sordida TaxID=392033 RepID=A0A816D7E8_9BILA|nr:unnamed protein product [Rotaria sordida]CAF1632101.1 unnamed protein product [Rotaria sordida]